MNAHEFVRTLCETVIMQIDSRTEGVLVAELFWFAITSEIWPRAKMHRRAPMPRAGIPPVPLILRIGVETNDAFFTIPYLLCTIIGYSSKLRGPRLGIAVNAAKICTYGGEGGKVLP